MTDHSCEYRRIPIAAPPHSCPAVDFGSPPDAAKTRYVTPSKMTLNTFRTADPSSLRDKAPSQTT